MPVTVGVDIGGSTTKIIGFVGGEIATEPALIHASDPLTALFGAFGKFITLNHLQIQDIESVMVTGLGAPFVTEPIYGIKTAKVDEFLAIGLGGLYLSGLNKAIVVSMGTGTAFVYAENGVVTHMGGSGVGGGTLMGLSKKLVDSHDIDHLLGLAENGGLSNVDLAIKDIAKQKMLLGDEVTVSNFGKMNDSATREDIALGLLNMTFQTIGVMSCFLSKAKNEENILLTGKLSTFEIAKEICDDIGVLHNVRFIVPKYSEFATAAGAAIAYVKNLRRTEV